MNKPLLSSTIEMPEFFANYPAIWQPLKSGIRLHAVQKGEVVFVHGDAAQALWLVQKGWMKLVRQTPDGKETVVSICTEGDIFGEAALFAHANYPYMAESLDDMTELYSIPADMLRKVLQQNSEFSSSIMAMLNARIAQTQLKLEHMSTLSSAQRLGCFLLRLCKTQANGSKILQIPVEKNVLAAYLGMKPETLSRSIQQMKEIGISVQGPKVEITSIPKLRDFVCNSCSEFGNCDTEAID